MSYYNVKHSCVYILSNKKNGTLYTGVTSNLVNRIWQHKNHVLDGFSKTYNLDLLVWYEVHESITAAISREKSIKKWNRKWKVALIEKDNPTWRDLYREIVG